MATSDYFLGMYVSGSDSMELSNLPGELDLSTLSKTNLKIVLNRMESRITFIILMTKY